MEYMKMKGGKQNRRKMAKRQENERCYIIFIVFVVSLVCVYVCVCEEEVGETKI